MSPPAEPRSETVQVTFIDFQVAIGVSEIFTPLTTSYPTFLSLLNALSGSVAHKLENLPHQYVQGQGFTLSDGGWWYRFVKPINDAVGEGGVGEPTLDRGPWTLLDCLYGYEKLVGELCLGVKWSGACVEVQHNLQKKRDEAGMHRAQEAGTNSHIFQQASVQYHHGHDSASVEPYYTVQEESQNNNEKSDSMSTVKDALRSGYDSRITSQDFRDNEDGGHREDEVPVDEGPCSSINKSNRAGKLSTTSTQPLIVTSPVVGIVPPDDDEGDVVTPKPASSTLVAKPASNAAEPIVAQLSTELVKGPGGITYLPAYEPRPSRPPSVVSLKSESLGGAPPDPNPKFYPPPPGATGSPNDKYRQVPRSGGAVRNPNHQPYQYQYGGRDQQLGGEVLPSVYSQQQQFPFPQQNIGESQYNSPASTYNQSGNLFSQSQRVTSQQRQPSDQKPSPQDSYRERAHGRCDVRKLRRGNGKNTESNKHSKRNQYQYSNRSNRSENPSGFPLDPALEVNYRNYNRQNNYNSGHGQYPSQNDTQNHYENQNQHAGPLHFGYNAGYGNGHGNSFGTDNAYRYNYPAPPAFNVNPIYYAPSAFAAQEQGTTPDFSPELEMTAPAQMALTPAEEQPRQPFVPSPLAAPFTPRFADVHQEHGEQVQAQDQDQGRDFAMGGDAGAFQYQLQGYGMLPLAPGSFANARPMSTHTRTDLIDQAPLLSAYERPKPPISMPPMGVFSPPKARKNGKHAKKILEKVVAGRAAESTSLIDDGNEDVVDDVVDANADADELDDGENEYLPQNEGRKKYYRKPKKPKNNQGPRLSSAVQDDAKAGAAGEGRSEDGGEGEGEGDNSGETDAAATPAAIAKSESGAHTEVEEDEKVVEG